jgi:hypothetical protein
MATRPHSEHSLSAMRSLFRIVGVTVKIAGSDEEVDGCDVADVWISDRAEIVFATTFKEYQMTTRTR